jgi:dienelactone hydrolase
MRHAASSASRFATLLALALILLLAAPAGAQVSEDAAAPQPSVALPPELARVLTDYEAAWQRRDATGLAALFAEDGFVMAGGGPPVRGRAAIERHYAGSGGPLALRALAYSTEGGVGYILGGYARRKGERHQQFTLTLPRAEALADRVRHGQRQRLARAAAHPYARRVDTARRPGSTSTPEPSALGTGPPTPRSPRAARRWMDRGRRLICVPAARRGTRGASSASGSTHGVTASCHSLGGYHHPAPLQDAQRAIRLVRARAAEWGVDPVRVGILGFSAGGHLASTAATHFDAGRPDAADPVERQGSRPDFAVLAYPVVSLFGPLAHSGSRRNLLGEPADPTLVELLSNERQVTARTPPTFLFHTADDASVPVANSLLFFEALQKAGVPAELHVFAHGKHGVGLAASDPALSSWPRLCATWMAGLGLLKPKS